MRAMMPALQKAASATLVPMFSSAKDTGTLWREGEMGYGRNPIVTAQMMAEKLLSWRARHLDQTLALKELTPGGVVSRPALR